MTTLYVVGNGFDIFHDLPTSYSDFYDFAKEILDEFAEKFCLDLGEIDPWFDFEKRLGDYDWGLVYDTYNEVDVLDDSFRPSMVFGLEDELIELTDNLVSMIDEQFHLWIGSINILKANKKLNLELNGIYLSFNYTQTLQLVYGINNDQINFIHGCASMGDRLIYGHTGVIEDVPEIDKDGENNRTMFTDAEHAAQYPFRTFRKPIEQVIASNDKWFLSLKGRIARVVVIGHSLQEIDLPYFKRIIDIVAGVPWVVTYHKECERKKHMLNLQSIGLDIGVLTQCHHDDLPEYL
ncbi:MAG: hypothetical protein HGA81_01430 [Chlorobium limicola]|nr:hypothetical protein [Chlorobium limicola]